MADMQLAQYSEYSVVVTGETKSHKEKLKELGGKFNPKLKTGPGWIFAKSKQDEIVKAFGDKIQVLGEITKAPGTNEKS